MFDADAYLLREATGTSRVVESARAVASALERFHIPHLVVGGLAVQEHGYPRTTIDADIVVPDVLEAAGFATADVAGSLVRMPEAQDRLRDRRTGVVIDLLPAGKVVRPGNKVPFPQPTIASDELQIVSLPQLIALKLDSWAGSPARRLRDKSDVVELIIRRRLPRDFEIDFVVRGLYQQAWDELRAES
jgi:hypothetical protein